MAQFIVKASINLGVEGDNIEDAIETFLAEGFKVLKENCCVRDCEGFENGYVLAGVPTTYVVEAENKRWAFCAAQKWQREQSGKNIGAYRQAIITPIEEGAAAPEGAIDLR